MRYLFLLYRFTMARSTTFMFHVVPAFRCDLTFNRRHPIINLSNYNITNTFFLFLRLYVRHVFVCNRAIFAASRFHRIGQRSMNIRGNRNFRTISGNLTNNLNLIRSTIRRASTNFRNARREIFLFLRRFKCGCFLYFRFKVKFSRFLGGRKRGFMRRDLFLSRRYVNVTCNATRSAASSMANLNITQRLSINGKRNGNPRVINRCTRDRIFLNVFAMATT